MVAMFGDNLKSIPLSRFITDFFSNSDILPVEKAYNEVGWFRRALDIRTEAVRTYPYDLIHGAKVIATEKPEDDDNVPQKINIFPILDDLSADLDMYGAAYAIFETNRWQRNGAWRRFHPKTMFPEFDADTGLLLYFERRSRYTARGEGEKYYPDDTTFQYIWMPNRTGEQGHGTGTAQAALTPATALHNIDKFQAAFFENGGMPPILASIDNFATLPKDEQERTQGMFQRMFNGLGSLFKARLIDGAIKIHQLITSLKEMSMDDLSEQKIEAILSAMGVPHSMVMSNAANYATATQDSLNFYNNAINGHVGMIQQQLNERLFKPMGYRLFFVKNRLEVYQVSEAEKATRLSSQIERGVIDVREYREQMDYEPNERLEAIFYERLESQVSNDNRASSGMDEAVSRLQLNPTGEQNSDSDAKSVQITDSTDTATQHLEMWQKKAGKRFIEGAPDKALEFYSDVIHPLQHKAIVEALQIASTLDDVNTIFKEATITAPLWDGY